jgi:sporulation protein YlmC with PRC-barrel domain
MRRRIVAEVLDEQIVDCNGEKAGRVDGIVLSLREGKPPLLTHVEVSPITLLSRLNRRLAHWYARHDRTFGKERGVAFRLPWSRISTEGPSFKMDLDVESTPINAFEDWLRVKIVGRIPGA